MTDDLGANRGSPRQRSIIVRLAIDQRAHPARGPVVGGPTVAWNFPAKATTPTTTTSLRPRTRGVDDEVGSSSLARKRRADQASCASGRSASPTASAGHDTSGFDSSRSGSPVVFKPNHDFCQSDAAGPRDTSPYRPLERPRRLRVRHHDPGRRYHRHSARRGGPQAHSTCPRHDRPALLPSGALRRAGYNGPGEETGSKANSAGASHSVFCPAP